MMVGSARLRDFNTLTPPLSLEIVSGGFQSHLGAAMSNHAQGTSVPAVFNFQSHEVRTITRNSEIWFVANDVCAALDYTHVPHAMRMLDDDEKGVHIVDTPSKNQHGYAGTQKTETSIINESGLYNLILKSRKPEAKAFKKWVTSEVLPSIRKTGEYRTPQPSDTLTKVQYQKLEALVSYYCDNLPEPDKSTFNTKAWAKLKMHFGVCHTQIPQSEFPEALAMVSTLAKEYPRIANHAVNAVLISSVINDAKAAKIKNQLLADYPQDYAPNMLKRRWLTHFDCSGKECVTSISENAQIITPTDAESLRTLIADHVPHALLPILIDSINKRFTSLISHV